ncbi:MAG: SBBP repeat-containing protein [Blastocatellia bacterium]
MALLLTLSAGLVLTCLAFGDLRAPLAQMSPVLTYSTYLGGESDEGAADMAIDSEGNVYITGNTVSTDFPKTPGAFSAPCSACAYVTKLNASGTALIYSAIIGPATSRDIAVDSAGQVYITGNAESSFPTTPGAYRTTGGGAFVAKLNATGSALVYSTFLGTATANGIAVGASRNAYVTGSAGAEYPTTSGSFQPSRASCSPLVVPCIDAFVTKLNPAGSALVYSTFVGGNDNDVGNAIAVDVAGQAHITGVTNSFNYPTANAFQPRKGGACTGVPGEFPCGPDVMVTKLNAAGSGLIYSSYLGGGNSTGTSGGPGTEAGLAITVDAFGNAYLTGNTDSHTFPTTPNAFQRSFNSGPTPYDKDAFVTKVSPAGTLVYSTYLGSDNQDSGEGIAVDRAGAVYVTGGSRSINFPLANPLPITGGIGAFVTEMNQTGTGLVFSTYLGIGRTDTGDGIGVDSAGRVYIAGTTPSFFTVTPGAYQTVRPGGFNAFATKLNPNAMSGVVTSASAASYIGLALAPDSIAAAFGADLAVATMAAITLPLPTSLAGTTVKVKDSSGAEFTAPLFFVSPNQINYLIPSQAAAGTAMVTVTSGDGKMATGTTQIQRVAPGVFAANSNGQGVAAAVALRIKADGSYSFEPVAQFNPELNRFLPIPLDLGPDTDQVFLLLFGTGIRGRSSSSSVKVTIAGEESPVTFAGAQGDFVGLDQVNVRLTRNLTGRGEANIVLLAEGYTSNVAQISIR